MPYQYQPYQSSYIGQLGSYIPSQYAAPNSQLPVMQPSNGLVKVNGYESALQYPLPPNSTSPVLLHASEDTFFIKRTDASGVGTVEQYDFVPHVRSEQPAADSVSRQEFEDLVARVDAMASASTKVRRAVKDGE